MNGRTQPHSEAPFVRGELEAVAARYRHVLEEHRRAHPRGRSRRLLERELAILSRRFERLLAHANLDDELRAVWRDHLHHALPAPQKPAAETVLAFGPLGAAEAPASTPVGVVTRGPVGRRARLRLEAQLERLVRLAPRSTVVARGTITYHENPSVAKPATAHATLDLGRRTIRAHAAAAGTVEAVDLLVERLRRALRELRGRDEAARRTARPAEPGLATAGAAWNPPRPAASSRRRRS